jgi:MFS family permease
MFRVTKYSTRCLYQAVCIIHVVPLKNRPQSQGAMAALMGVATVAGPLIGGALTSKVTWRWCFYINLPLGGVAIAVVFFFLDIPRQNTDTEKLSLSKKLAQFDLPGVILFMPCVVCLLLALEWGGQEYSVGFSYHVAQITWEIISSTSFLLTRLEFSGATHVL